MTKDHPILELTRLLVNVPGWTFIGMFEDPPTAPEGFRLETRDDGFLGFITHYRHVRLEQPMAKPVRLQLSRQKGFDLQALSLATNGLPAVVVSRPGRWGNPVTKQSFDDVQAILLASGGSSLPGTWRQHAVECFDAWIGGEIPELGEPPSIENIVAELRGKNLACWCPLGECCHADVLLGLANE